MNEEIMKMDTANAYKILYHEAYPDGSTKNIDNMYLISTSSGSDDENNVFILKGNNKVRVVASRFRPDEAIKRLVDDEETIQDVTIETEEFEDMIYKIERCINVFEYGKGKYYDNRFY